MYIEVASLEISKESCSLSHFLVTAMLIYMFRLFQDFVELSLRSMSFIMHSNDLGYYLYSPKI